MPEIIQDVFGVDKKKLLHENENYELWVAKLPEVSIDCYAAIHKKHKVVEMSTSVLANGLKMVAMLDQWALNPKGDEEVIGELPDIIPDPSMFQ